MATAAHHRPPISNTSSFYSPPTSRSFSPRAGNEAGLRLPRESGAVTRLEFISRVPNSGTTEMRCLDAEVRSTYYENYFSRGEGKREERS